MIHPMPKYWRHPPKTENGMAAGCPAANPISEPERARPSGISIATAPCDFGYVVQNSAWKATPKMRYAVANDHAKLLLPHAWKDTVTTTRSARNAATDITINWSNVIFSMPTAPDRHKKAAVFGGFSVYESRRLGSSPSHTVWNCMVESSSFVARAAVNSLIRTPTLTGGGTPYRSA